MRELCSISTVITYKESKYMIIGYSDYEKDDKLIPAYVVVPVSLGYMDRESLRVIDIDDDYEITQDGYSDEFGRKYLSHRKNLFDQMTEGSISRLNEETGKLINELDVLQKGVKDAK